jgi:hypothetical protein
LTAGLASDTPRRMGRRQINDPDEAMTARFAAGTLARIKAVLLPKEPLAAFMRSAVERELKRRERTKPKPD